MIILEKLTPFSCHENQKLLRSFKSSRCWSKLEKDKKKCFEIIRVVSFYEGPSTNFVKHMGYNDNSLLQIHPPKQCN
jgi:hypothetical protein